MMIIKRLKVALVLTSLIFVNCKESTTKNTDDKQSQTVILKGKVENNFSEDSLTVVNYSKSNLYFDEETHRIPINQDQTFNYSFTIDKPAYYRLGRSYMYLSPGDSLNIVLTDARATTSFKGKGAEANNYLTTVTYPKGGSFWGDLREVPKEEGITDYKQAPEVFKKILDKRLAQLDSVKNVSEEFIALEKARLRFDYINSLETMFYLYYPELRKGEITEEEMDDKIAIANTYFIPYKKEAMGEFNNEGYLQLEVFQSLLYNLKNEKYRADHEFPELNSTLNEYTITNDLIYGFNNNGYTQEFIADYKEKRKEIRNEKYLLALDQKESKYDRIKKGSEAPDVEFVDLDDTTIKLSNYKGKVIVVDLWATWCGPCMNEKPYYEALEEKYKTNDDIVFLSVSIDKKEIWKSYFEKNEAKGHHLQISRDNLSEYQVMSIPRFFVIDKDFKIVDVFAPVPSSGKLEALIQETI